jgi:hypothetical protein
MNLEYQFLIWIWVLRRLVVSKLLFLLNVVIYWKDGTVWSLMSHTRRLKNIWIWKLHKHNFGWEKTSLAAIQPKVVAIFQCSQMGSQPFVFVSLCVCVIVCMKRERERVFTAWGMQAIVELSFIMWGWAKKKQHNHCQEFLNVVGKKCID